MLLHYITGVLPTLEVDHVQAMTMTEFLESILDQDWKKQKKKMRYGSDFRTQEELREEVRRTRHFKGSLAFVQEAEQWIDQLERRLLTREDAILEGKGDLSSGRSGNFLPGFPTGCRCSERSMCSISG